MRALETRLARLEALRPIPIAASQPVGRMKLKLDEIIADGKRFKGLTAKEQVAELRADLRAHQKELRQPGDFVARSAVPGLHEKLVKLNFEDVIAEQLHTAETRLLAELGHPNARHPLPTDLRELVNVEMFEF